MSTIYASLLRWIPRVKFQRERIFIPEGDFLDLDWSKSPKGSGKLIFILAGLEGKSSSLYARSAIRYFNRKGWDAVCMNYRGCSGEPNLLLEGYHMGQTADVKFSIEHILAQYSYQEIHLIGYSLGGNLALKYLGEEAHGVPKEVKSSISFSVPMNIRKSNERLNQWYNWHYLKWFMMPLNYKANRKKKQFPDVLNHYKGFFMSGNFVYFDTHYTAPANGFESVEHYWEQSSCKQYLPHVKVDSLIVSSENDTFISDECYPLVEAQSNPFVHLEITKFGGHCGFIRNFFEKQGWMEERAYQFAQNLPKTTIPKSEHATLIPERK